MNRILSLIKLFVGWPLTLIALFFIGKVLFSHSKNFQIFLHPNWILLALSMLCFLIYFFLRAFFWQKLLKEKGIHYSYKETAFIWGTSEMARYIPGNIWSFLSRSYHYTKKQHALQIVVASLVGEMSMLFIACLVLSLLSINFLIYGFFTFPLQQLAVVLATIAMIFLLYLFVMQKHIPLFSKMRFAKHIFDKFTPSSMLQLLFIMVSAFFMFGLATYFSIASLFYLYPGHVLPLIGFFVFSFLVGYVSFVTPMGLGVREAIMTAGLVKYLSLSAAATGAVFSRIILILSELLFLCIIVVWRKLAEYSKRIELFVLQHKYEVFLALCIALYIAYFTTATFLKYNNFFTGRFDLGNMDQTVWNTVHGRFFQLTNPDGTNIVSRLSYHADYTLVLLAPFYYIWQDPRMLLLIQTIILSFGALFVYLIGKRLFTNSFVSFVFALLFLINPSVNNTNLYDFHAVTLATTFFLASWYFLMRKKTLPLVICLFLAGTTKEEAWFVVGLIGIYAALWKQMKIMGVSIAAISFGLFYYLFWHAIPQARGGGHFALSYYSDFGTTQWQVIKGILFSPLKLITTVAKNGSLPFLAALFAPLAFLAVLSPFFLLFAGGDFAIDLLSNNSQLHSITFQYTAILTPFVFLSSMYGFVTLTKLLHFKKTYMALFVLLVGIVCAYFFGPLPGARTFSYDMFTNQLPYAGNIDVFLLSIPRRYSVAATNNVGSHLSHRQKIYTIPNGINEADIIVMLLNDQYAQPSLASQKKLAQKLQHDPLYVQLFQEGDFIAFRKKSVPVLIRRPQRGIIPIFKGN